MVAYIGRWSGYTGYIEHRYRERELSSARGGPGAAPSGTGRGSGDGVSPVVRIENGAASRVDGNVRERARGGSPREIQRDPARQRFPFVLEYIPSTANFIIHPAHRSPSLCRRAGGRLLQACLIPFEALRQLGTFLLHSPARPPPFCFPTNLLVPFSVTNSNFPSVNCCSVIPASLISRKKRDRPELRLFIAPARL